MSHLFVAVLLAACQHADDEPQSQAIAAEKACAKSEVFSMPIQGQANADWFVSNYLDVDPSVGIFSDYRGGFFTYDQHLGTDFALRDFDQMYRGVDVYSVKCGTVTAIHELEQDRNTETNSQQWNYVEIAHLDGSRSVYGHLKQHSVVVNIGDIVAGGTKIAEVGSSGNSTGPHLHFELLDSNDRAMDPFAEDLLNDAYIDQPHILAAGITTNTDPALETNFFLTTPASLDNVTQSEGVVVWLKALGLEHSDSITIILLDSNGDVARLRGMDTQRNYKASYWYWELGGLMPGQNRIEILVNDVLASTHRIEVN